MQQSRAETPLGEGGVGGRGCGVGECLHSGWDQHMHSPAANTMVCFRLVNLRMLPKAVLHWIDVGKWRIRESREICSKGSLQGRRNETVFSLH